MRYDSPQAAERRPQVRIRLFGRFSVEVAGRTADDLLRKEVASQLLALLALRRGGEADRDRVASLLWPQAADRLNNLRQRLRDVKAALGEHVLASADGRTLRLDLARVEIDLMEWEKAVGLRDEARAPEVARALDGYRTLLEGWEFPWVRDERARIRRMAADAHVWLAGLARKDRRFAEALEHLESGARIEGAWRGTARLALLEALEEAGYYDRALRINDELEALASGRGAPEGELAETLRRLRKRSHEAAEAPPLDSGLPPRPLDLVMRDADEEAVRWLVASEPLVTVVGPPGVGKTDLAVAAAHALRPNYPGGVRYVSLGEIPPESPDAPADAAVAERVRLALGIEDLPARDLPRALAARLAAADTLLVLDNCEHVLSAVAALLEHLLRAGDPHILTTSRWKIGAREEAAYALEPLPLPAEGAWREVESFRQQPCVRVFCRAAGFQATPDNAEAVDRLCRLSGGLPLDLRLIGALAADLGSAEALVGEMKRLSDLEPRDPEGGRQSTRWRSVDWTYALLDGSERDVFRRESLFAAGFSLEAAEAVAGGADAGRVARTVLSLRRRSLLMPDGVPSARLRMLAPVREYAAARLAEWPEERTASVERFLAYYARYVEEEPLKASPDEDRLAPLDPEYDNIVGGIRLALDGGDSASALRIANRLWEYWRTRGRLSEGRERLRAILTSAADDAPSRDLGTAQFGAADLAAAQGDVEDAMRGYRRSLRTWKAAGYTLGVAGALEAIAVLLKAKGRYGRAMRLHETALGLREAHAREVPKSADLVTQSLNNMAVIHLETGHPEAALPLLDRALRILTEGRLKGPYGPILDNMGSALVDMGKLVEGREKWRQSEAIYRRDKDLFNLVFALASLGEVSCGLGDLSAAESYLAEAAAINDKMGHANRGAMIRRSMARVALLRKDYRLAGQHLAEAIASYAGAGESREMVVTLERVAFLWLQADRPAEAGRILGAADAARLRLGIARLPAEEAEFSGDIEAVTGRLGRKRLDAELRAGGRMGLEEAATFALERLSA